MLMEKLKEGSCAVQPVFGYGGGGGLNILQLFQELISPVNDMELPDVAVVAETFPPFVPDIPPPAEMDTPATLVLPPLQEDPFLDPPPPTSPPPQQQIFSLNAVPVPLTSSPTSFIYFTDTGAAMSWEIVDESQGNAQIVPNIEIIDNQIVPNIEIYLTDPAAVHNNDSGLPGQNSSH